MRRISFANVLLADLPPDSGERVQRRSKFSRMKIRLAQLAVEARELSKGERADLAKYAARVAELIRKGSFDVPIDVDAMGGTRA